MGEKTSISIGVGLVVAVIGYKIFRNKGND